MATDEQTRKPTGRPEPANPCFASRRGRGSGGAAQYELAVRVGPWRQATATAHLPCGRSTAGRRRARRNHDPRSHRKAHECWRQTRSGILGAAGNTAKAENPTKQGALQIPAQSLR
jgi:hypothetical protein